MYHPVINQCIQSLKTMRGYLNKTEAHAQNLEIDINILLGARLAPDMQDFRYQLRSACDYVKAAAGRLAGQQPPKHEDNEYSLAELRERLDKTLAYAGSVSAEAYSEAEGLMITVPWMPGKEIAGDDYLLQIIIPNVYFHISMGYAILRNNGVPLGKMDFLEPINFIDAENHK